MGGRPNWQEALAKELANNPKATLNGGRRRPRITRKETEQREEIRESWDYLITDKLVHCGEITNTESFGQATRHIERYVKAELWFEGRIRIHTLIDPVRDYDILFTPDVPGTT